MINLESYRSSQDYKEILRLLQASSTQEGNLLWQSTSVGKSVLGIKHYEIDFVGREIVIFPLDQSKKLDPKLPLYVKLNHRMSIFKVLEFRVSSNNTVHFAFPTEIKTLELRLKPRHQFSEKEEMIVTLSPDHLGEWDNVNDIFVRVADISEDGLGLIVSEKNRQFIKNNKFLWVTHIGKEALTPPLKGEVVYFKSEVNSKVYLKKEKSLKVGMKMSGKFSQAIRESFSL